MPQIKPQAIRVTALALLASLCFFSYSAIPHRSTGMFQVMPLSYVAPDDPLDSAAGTARACTYPPVPDPTTQPRVGSTFIHCYTPAQIYAAYGVDQVHAAGWTGKGQTIVIVDSYGSPTAQHDLDVFSDTFGLPRTTIQIYYPDGQPTYSTIALKGAEPGWAFEVSLDLQWAHAIAPDAHLVLVAGNPAETQGVQGLPSLFKGIEWATQNFPGAIISQSFGTTEQAFPGGSSDIQLASYHQDYLAAAANKLTVLASAGDNGTANTDKQNHVFSFPTVIYPASDPAVTAAGGTWLQYGWTWNPLISANEYHNSGNLAQYLNFTTTPGSKTEAVWKEDWLPAATGGGLSSIFAEPSYQNGLAQTLLQGKRGLPDVSWNAVVDGGVLVYTSFPGARVGWHIVGGTSAASPQLAGLIALVDQKAGKPVGLLNSYLYNLPPSDFQDIVPQTFGTGAGVTTLDSNTEYGSGVAGFSTTTGYDLTTGRGVPAAVNFVNDLAAAVQNS